MVSRPVETSFSSRRRFIPPGCAAPGLERAATYSPCAYSNKRLMADHSKLVLIGLRVIIIAIIVCTMSACATIFAKDTRSIMITSNPSGAEIHIDGRAHGTTPTRIKVNDHERLEVTIVKQGFKPGGCYINTSVEAVWIVVDVLLIYTVVPIVVDLITGEWSSLNSAYCTVQLAPVAEHPQ